MKATLFLLDLLVSLPPIGNAQHLDSLVLPAPNERPKADIYVHV